LRLKRKIHVLDILLTNFADDIIGYLAPSLEDYKGCTLIDVHPGACLWSSKLHDFLKPKRHVLMEPDMRYFEPFVKPLLDQPGSTYRHTRLVGAHAREYWNNYTTLLDDQELVPDRPGLEPNDPKLREIDTSILLTGNLWRRYPILHKTRYVDHTTLLLQHMTYAALTNDIFQRSGLVRQLWWASDACKQAVWPTTVRGKRTFDLALQMGATVTEVAGTTRIEDTKRNGKSESPRTTQMDASVLGRVARRMAAKGIKEPPGRQMPSNVTPLEEENDVHVKDSILATTCTTIEDLKAAIEKHDDYLKYMALELPEIKGVKVRITDPNMTPERAKEVLAKYVRYQQCTEGVYSRAKMAQLKSSTVAIVRGAITMDVEARLINLEANYAAVRDTNPDPAALAACHDEILRLTKENDKLIAANAGAVKTDICNSLLQDVMSAEALPETLSRDRRPYEPLQAHPEEFWPGYDITLLDILPNTADLSVPGIADRTEGTRICQDLLRHLYHSPALSIKSALERLAPNAAQDLIPAVPALTDARKGGRLDSGKMPVRMLTADMMRGLVAAFFEWPFRPSKTEMMMAEEGESGEEEEEGGEVEPEVEE
jgi:transcription factor 1